jgi:hypothetical protein
LELDKPFYNLAGMEAIERKLVTAGTGRFREIIVRGI